MIAILMLVSVLAGATLQETVAHLQLSGNPGVTLCMTLIVSALQIAITAAWTKRADIGEHGLMALCLSAGMLIAMLVDWHWWYFLIWCVQCTVAVWSRSVKTQQQLD